MSNEKFEEGRRRATELAAEQKAEKHRAEIRANSRKWLIALVASCILFVVLYARLYVDLKEQMAIPRLTWIPVTAQRPAPWTPLVVAKRDGSWDAGFLNDEGEFQRYCDGTRIRGAWYYIAVPQHP